MSTKNANADLSWNDRFALMDHYTPEDGQVLGAFGLTTDELTQARECRTAGAFAPTPDFNCEGFGNPFANVTAIATEGAVATATATTKAKGAKQTRTAKAKTTKAAAPTGDAKTGTATVHQRPETATKKTATKAAPKRRGRKGDKISTALQAVPSDPVLVQGFLTQYGVSLAVMRQAKRFLERLPKEVQDKIGRVCVRQDKVTRQLMIWRENPQQVPASIASDGNEGSAPTGSTETVKETATTA